MIACKVFLPVVEKTRFIHCISVEGRDGKSKDLLLFFRPLSLRGLHTKDFLWSATNAGCLATLESACVGLPINLLLLLMEIGVVSEDGLISGSGANNLEYRAFLWFLITDC